MSHLRTPDRTKRAGYQVGAYMFNIALVELGFVIVLVGVLVSTWPNPPWSELTWMSVGLMVLLPVPFYPFSKTLFLGFHLLFIPWSHRSRRWTRCLIRTQPSIRKRSA